MLLVAASLMSTPAAAQMQGAEATSATNASLQLFQQDWLLMNWALRNFDADKDVQLSADEAVRAAAAFKQIADGNSDGRVTQDEFRRGREFILARY
jgi:hypothetical protein